MKICSRRRWLPAHRGQAEGLNRPRMLRQGRTRPVALGLAVAAAAALAVPASASASTGTSPVTGHVYVDDNTAGPNTIGAFDRHADGTLTPRPGPGSPPAVLGPAQGSRLRGHCRSRRMASS
jgi:hypothetical protein